MGICHFLWNSTRTLRDRCQEKEWKRTNGKSPRSCQCRAASASEKATQRARPKWAVLENTMNSPAFRFILWLCADWYDESQRSAHVLISIHFPFLLYPSLPSSLILYDTGPCYLWEHLITVKIRLTRPRCAILHGHLLQWDKFPFLDLFLQ